VPGFDYTVPQGTNEPFSVSSNDQNSANGLSGFFESQDLIWAGNSFPRFDRFKGFSRAASRRQQDSRQSITENDHSHGLIVREK